MDRINLRNTFGAGFIGALITMILYGVTTLQTYLYFMYYPNDSLDTKLMVTAIWILDTLHISLMSHALYYYLISNYGNAVALVDGTWSLYASLAVNLCIAVSVQTWMLIVLAHFGFGLETVVLMFMKKEFAALSEITLSAATPFAITAVLSDVCIAGALCVLLHGNRSPFYKTNLLVNTLIIYAINRCLLTSAVAVAEVIMFAISPHSLWFLAIDFVIGKLYANSFLASLNSRSSLRGRGLHSDVDSSMRMNTVDLSDLRVSPGEDSGSHAVNSTDKPKGAHATITNSASTVTRVVNVDIRHQDV
ncbi:hypothetical protein HYDPIDRAFT_28656 [Hydnomerulius pinastri MD-312]|uniref:DUF6534 domain-containing protein n=1 Tax=Hydnomerulius pinastri MD-312 TaxID=994086 RepID=A0A0C9W975_9AGAM|nr:hypothetical protein HYDPIDRAFT_28656 [Hydnomerulius pinastri MD-312]